MLTPHIHRMRKQFVLHATKLLQLIETFTDKTNSEEREHLLVPGLMSDMSIKGPVFWMRAG